MQLGKSCFTGHGAHELPRSHLLPVPLSPGHSSTSSFPCSFSPRGLFMHILSTGIPITAAAGCTAVNDMAGFVQQLCGFSSPSPGCQPLQCFSFPFHTPHWDCLTVLIISTAAEPFHGHGPGCLQSRGHS